MDNTIETWAQGYFVDQPQYRHWSAEAKADANCKEALNVRPSPTGNAICRTYNPDAAEWIAQRLNMAAKLEALANKLHTAESAKVPEGWVAVPKEPTPEMLLKGGDYFDGDSFYHATKIYKAMLAAAPKAQAEKQEPTYIAHCYAVDGVALKPSDVGNFTPAGEWTPHKVENGAWERLYKADKAITKLDEALESK